MTKILAKLGFLALPTAILLGGCTRDYKFQPVDMWNGTRLKPYEQINYFDTRTVSQQMPAGTVARGQLRQDEPLFYGTQNGTPVAKSPLRLSKAVLERGQERYNIYCQPCHGLSGYGNGMIVKRGLSAPPSYHIQRLRTAPDGHFFDVITNGYGAMYSYGSRVPARDRWAIVAYIRTMQRAQMAPAASVPAKIKAQLDANPGETIATLGGEGGSPHIVSGLPGQMPHTTTIPPRSEGKLDATGTEKNDEPKTSGAPVRPDEPEPGQAQ